MSPTAPRLFHSALGLFLVLGLAWLLLYRDAVEHRVLVVIGTRPEAIKLAPVINALRATPDELTVAVCVTGQHREMLTPILELFEIVPEYQLGLMTPNQKLARLTSAIQIGRAHV